MLKECLKWDRNELTIMGGVYKTDIEELEALHVDVISIQIGMLCAWRGCQVILNGILANIIVKIYYLGEAGCLKVRLLKCSCRGRGLSRETYRPSKPEKY